MKKLFILLFLLLPLLALAQPLEPYRHNFFTTNPAPVVDVVAGSNAFITPIIIGTDTRRFRVDIPASGAATNIMVSAAGTNIVIVTNAFVYTISVDMGFTNQFATTNFANGVTNGFPWGVLYDPAGAATAATNGYVWTNLTVAMAGAVTNGWPWTNLTVAHASAVTNGYPWTNLIVAYAGAVTNGYPWTNLTVAHASAVTNGYPWTNLTVAMAGAVTNGYPWTNLTVAHASAVTNGYPWTNIALAYLPLSGGTETGPVLSTSSTTNAPSATELATAGWVRSLFSGGFLYYASTNIVAGATNNDTAGQPVYAFVPTIPSSSSRSYVNPSALTYVGAVMTTNTFTFLDSPVTVNAYMALTTGGGDAMTLNPELYYSYDKTNWFGDWDCQAQNIVGGVTNLYQFVITFPAQTATNSSGFYIERRFRVKTKGGTPTLTFLVGTNTASGTNNASHISLSGPNSAAGNAYLANNQTFTGTNTFTQTIIGNSSTATTATNLVFLTNALVNPNLITLASVGSGNYAGYTTNDNIVITGLNNVDSSATTVQWAVRIFTNTAGTTKTLTLPASFIGVNTTEYLTNQGVLSLVLYPGLGTNAVWRCLK